MTSQTLHSGLNIPTIDMSMAKLMQGTNSWLQSCAEVRRALEEHGCFVALYDDDQLSSELSREVFDVVEELFDLPTKTKVKNSGDVFLNGYIGQLPHAPLHESMGISNATTVEGVEGFTNLMWPQGNSRFRNSILSYAKTMENLENLVDKMVFDSYGAGKHYEKHIESTTYILRPLKYKPLQVGEENGSIGSNVHTDKSFLSIIHQTQVNALQVETKQGDWIDVDFPPHSFVVMAGDAYEAWSNGRILSAKHRVIMRSEEKPRYCMGFFTFNEGTVEIPEEVVDEEHPLQYNPFNHMGLVRFYQAAPSTHDKTASTAPAYCGINAA